ncbi:MAG: aminopeptidase N [Limnobacter sp.]|nr:aminopeptidase N [Limnobacter sp.]
MRDAQAPITFYRKDYTPPNHRILKTDLEFHLQPENTKVVSTLRFETWSDAVGADAPLVLDGEDLELVSVVLNGKTLSTAEYTCNDTQLLIPNAGSQGVVEITVFNQPAKNTRLEGLYVSNGNFFTQCEAQGFRRITYFPDRPDVLSRFEVTLITHKEAHPVSLSNGNLLEEKSLADGQWMTRWKDPFPKPAYLFALVAGKFVCQEEKIRKGDGKEALLQVWVEPGNLDKTDFAMQSLKRSIDWDRERFNLDLDLDRFMIVATGDFNMGAMENKGLNIFNTKFVFANPELATDVDFENVESVVGHEYFHNWTGNRVTCQDWFQLSLKEGLTVFRDQEFTGDMLAEGLDEAQSASARAVKRIDDVKVLRSAQFPEDAGPMAHPIRPDSYQEINNFYTVTVYEKGAEVIRMQHTLLGEKAFQRGMQLYFERHDGHAVTCDDFVNAMETALQESQPQRDLQQFRHWYSQAGTPLVDAQWSQDLSKGELTLTLTQSCPPTPGQLIKPEFHIPVRLGLLNPAGEDVPLHLKDNTQALLGDVLNLTAKQQKFVFTGITQKVVPSVLRGFSAPVHCQTQHSLEELIFLASHDTDAFNRWDAGQKVYAAAIIDILKSQGDTQGALAQGAVQVFGRVLQDNALSDGYKALTLQLPGEGYLFESIDGLVDPVALHMARCTLRDLLAVEYAAPIETLYSQRNKPGQAYEYNAIAAGERSLKNVLLGYLTAVGGDNASGAEAALAQYQNTNNMTDRIAALNCLVHQTEEAATALSDFYTRFEKEPLALDKWFMVQATRPASAGSGDSQAVLGSIEALAQHPAFTLKNPNRARSVLGALAMQNPSVFHSHNGEGYAFWANNVIALNSINPQVAARMARALDRWTKLVPSLQVQAQKQLERILAADGLSTDVKEIIGKALASATH